MENDLPGNPHCANCIGTLLFPIVCICRLSTIFLYIISASKLVIFKFNILKVTHNLSQGSGSDASPGYQ